MRRASIALFVICSFVLTACAFAPQRFFVVLDEIEARIHAGFDGAFQRASDRKLAVEARAAPREPWALRRRAIEAGERWGADRVSSRPSFIERKTAAARSSRSRRSATSGATASGSSTRTATRSTAGSSPGPSTTGTSRAPTGRACTR